MSAFEVLLVDNASTDATPDLIARLSTLHPGIHGVVESRVGLSHARNTGFREARGEWVAYLDDDAIPAPGWVKKILELIADGRFDGVGGLFRPHFEGPRPAWYLDEYNSNCWMLREGESLYELGRNDPKLSGGNCAFRRAVLEELGGFSSALGMRGDRVGYSEEVDLQNRMLERGYRLGFDESMLVDHHTPAYKQRLGWFFERAFASGRDLGRMKSSQCSHQITNQWNAVVRGAIGAIKWEARNLLRSAREMVRGGLHWQNALVRTAEPIAHYLGWVYGAIRRS